MSSQQPHLFTFMNHDEWKLAFVVAFISTTDQYEDIYPLKRYATPGLEGESNDWIELFKRAIRYLALECDFTFSGLEVYRDGRMTGTPVCPQNVMYAAMLSGNLVVPLPDLPLAFQTAIQVADVEGRAPGLDVEPIRDALARVERDLAQALAEADPDVARGLAELRTKALREVGVVVTPSKLTIN